jgi:hypothetical protein
MRKLSIVLLMLAFVALPLIAAAQPVPGTYMSANRGGAVFVGRSTVARPTVNSGNPKIFHGQSWDGAVLGTQWEMGCGAEAVDQPPDYSQFDQNTGTGFITYHQSFSGGTFTMYPDVNVGWGSGTATLNVTNVTSQVYLVNFVPVSSSFTAFTSGHFDDSPCSLEFAFGNGFGVGETPYANKPADYPTFLAPDCSPADAAHQFGVWGDTNDIILNIYCPVPAQESTWGHVKAIYR